MMRKKATKIITWNHVENCIKWPEVKDLVMCIFALTLILISYYIVYKEKTRRCLACGHLLHHSHSPMLFDFGVRWPHLMHWQCYVSSLDCTHLLLISHKWVSNSQNFANNLGDFMVFFWSSCFLIMVIIVLYLLFVWDGFFGKDQQEEYAPKNFVHN